MSNWNHVGGHLSESTPHPIGVIIPTYNRSEVLLSCLAHLERQTWKDFEVVVVDDGSTDSTPGRMEEYQRKGPLSLRYIRQENSGPARARNAAIRALRSPVCLMIGDDILASPGLVLTHLRLHERRPEAQVAGLGLTRWSDSGQTVTRFMRWLDTSGKQFAYGELLRGTPPDWKHFYTSNLSLKTQFLRENPFDESFTMAAAEDLELGYRIQQRHGLEVVFLPDALAEHLHPTSFRQACRRMFNVGIATRRFHDLWPDSAEPARNSRLRSAAWEAVLGRPWLLSFLTSAADMLTTLWCPNPLMIKVLRAHFNRGYRNLGWQADTFHKHRPVSPL
jgi:glycosyltransferase involved in cell wall biosynthesis